MISDKPDLEASFMYGKLRIVLATVAFGMGIDKRDIQEIGRAGRDGLADRAHLFLDNR